MYTIKNDKLKITISDKGAELKSILHLAHSLEYMWSGDPAYWAKTSPVLFPIVGTLKENTYVYKDRAYTLSRHGFARDKTFTVTSQQDHSITFSLASDSTTLEAYPFAFVFYLVYTLKEDTLSVSYQVENTGNSEMFFSVGGHPAFKVPLVDGTSYTDYKVTFEKEETINRWPISKDGLIELNPIPFMHQSNELLLTKDLFQKDAIVLKSLHSKSVQLSSNKTPHGLRFSFSDFPYLGLWAAPRADFLCIEPWCGIADSVNSDQRLENKEGIIALPPSETFKAQWMAAFF
ncbi:MAG TPA: aldose 1-epimerase family protein [Flavisolibacter sp.]|nr:aldose 1-epimerase family protein [Flavisolibacter sp.]